MCAGLLPPLVTLKPLGEHTLKDLAQPELISQLTHPELRDNFPPLKRILAPADDNVPSIAVLPFLNMSRDSENEYFADGLSEELMNVLAKINGLRVASRTSAFSFKGKDTDIPTIAQKLNVANVLEGSVRMADKRVRITTQLIQVMTDSHLWSETYDRQLDDIFVVQDDITQSVVTLRRADLEAPDKSAGAKVRRRWRWRRRAASERRRLPDLSAGTVPARAATREDRQGDSSVICRRSSGSGICARVGEAVARLLGSGGRHWVPSPRASRGRKPRLSARSTSSLNSPKRTSRWVGCFVPSTGTGRRRSGIPARAGARPGSTIAMNGAANLLATLGRLDKAIEISHKAMLLDPLNVPLHRNHALCLGAGELEEAEAVLHKVLQMSPQVGSPIAGWVSRSRRTARRRGRADVQEITEIFRFLGLTVAHNAIGNWAESDEGLISSSTSSARIARIRSPTPTRPAATQTAFEWFERAYARALASLSAH
jgi:TolB-like protein